MINKPFFIIALVLLITVIIIIKNKDLSDTVTSRMFQKQES